MNTNVKSRYLTKSRFKLGLECPTKLYYTGKYEYPDNSLEDSFLSALAEGGYQVGELAQRYYPDGYLIETLDTDKAVEQTQALLQQKNVVIFEAAIKHQNLLIRIDILVKSDDHYELIEVKAKSYDPSDIRFISKKTGELLKSWAPYLYDVAFQRHVLSNALQTTDIDSYLMLADKTAVSVTDGLNTKFKIVKNNHGRKGIEVSNTLTAEDLKSPLLGKVCVNQEIRFIYEEADFEGRSFELHIKHLASMYQDDTRVQGSIGSKCKGCQFQCSEEEELSGSQNGFKECWKRSLDWNDDDFGDPKVTDIWNFRSADKLIQQGKIKLIDMDEDDLVIKENDQPGLSASQRQWLQVEKAQHRDNSIFIDNDGLEAEMAKWVYPLHFIDFETTATALPFTKGRRPYEGIAFQFSHHIVYEDGRVEHAGQFLDTTIGHFPSFDFVKELKKQLEKDEGTIFKYSNHENTYLNMIFWQLKDSGLPQDEVTELCEFIKTITHSKGKSSVKWKGDRDMVDMLELVKKYYYAPSTNGSNSIKYVLPAILDSSSYIKEKYSKPIYGGSNGIKSLNFSDWQWVMFDGGSVIDPYKLLPNMFQDAPDNVDDLLSESNSLANGGAALTAYAKIQFTEMSDYERDELRNALLKYCELDTLAMVMIYETWLAQLN